jgi:hypothetical protein
MRLLLADLVYWRSRARSFMRHAATETHKSATARAVPGAGACGERESLYWCHPIVRIKRILHRTATPCTAPKRKIFCQFLEVKCTPSLHFFQPKNCSSTTVTLFCGTRLELPGHAGVRRWADARGMLGRGVGRYCSAHWVRLKRCIDSVWLIPDTLLLRALPSTVPR